MPTQTLIPAQTAAVATHVDFPSDWYQDIMAAATGLAGTEEVDIFVKIGSVYVLATDHNGSVVKLTAAAPSRPLVGGPVYGFIKDATASPAGVYAITSRGNKRR